MRSSLAGFPSRRSIPKLFSALIALCSLSAAQAQTASNTYVFTHLAGPLGGTGNADGVGSAARFTYPSGVTVDASGNVLVLDNFTQAIRKVTPNGSVSTFANINAIPISGDDTNRVWFSPHPSGLALDRAGNVYVAAPYLFTILKVAPDGSLITLAGSPGTQGSADGTGFGAQFDTPVGIAVDGSGNVYVADVGNHTIRKISPSGVTTTVAGSAGVPGSADGSGTAALFNSPSGVAVDANNNLYVADSLNSCVRKITPDGTVTTLAGTAGTQGTEDGIGAAARFFYPTGVAVDGTGNVYVTDAYSNDVRKIAPNGAVTTLAGAANEPGSADGTGSAVKFNQPSGLAVDNAGNVYIADYNNSTIRKSSPGGVVTTLAGLAGGYGSANGSGTAAQFNSPIGVVVDNAGSVYVADAGNSTIRKVTAAGMVTTIAGMAGSLGSVDGAASTAQFSTPFGIALDSAGNLFVSDQGNNTIRKITTGGMVSTFAGTDGVSGSTDGNNALFNIPCGIAIDGSSNLYVADQQNQTIRKITSSGSVSTLAGVAGVSGSVDGAASLAQFNNPSGVAVDAGGNVYVADLGNNTIRKITPGGVVTTLAGTGAFGDADGPGSSAQFLMPTGVAVDSAGNLYVSEYLGSVIRKITPGGMVVTVAGTSSIYGGADGVGSSAQFNVTAGIAVDRAGNLYIADYLNSAIRKGELAGPPVITAQPQSQSVQAGAKVLLSATITSSLPLTYQWYLNNTAVAGANGSFLEIPSASFASGGAYTLTAANQLGSVTTNAAVLTVAPIPATSGGGGGSMEPWFALALLGFELARRKQKRNAYFNRTRFEVR